MHMRPDVVHTQGSFATHGTLRLHACRIDSDDRFYERMDAVAGRSSDQPGMGGRATLGAPSRVSSSLYSQRRVQNEK